MPTIKEQLESLKQPKPPRIRLKQKKRNHTRKGLEPSLNRIYKKRCVCGKRHDGSLGMCESCWENKTKLIMEEQFNKRFLS